MNVTVMCCRRGRCVPSSALSTALPSRLPVARRPRTCSPPRDPRGLFGRQHPHLPHARGFLANHEDSWEVSWGGACWVARSDAAPPARTAAISSVATDAPDRAGDIGDGWTSAVRWARHCGDCWPQSRLARWVGRRRGGADCSPGSRCGQGNSRP